MAPTELKNGKSRSTVPKPIPAPKVAKAPAAPPLLPDVPEPGLLPPFLPMAASTFKWAPGCDGKTFIASIDNAYEIVTKWRKNVFKLPSGHSGKSFTKALTRLYEGYALRSPLECIDFKAAAVIALLLLQQPSGKPIYRETCTHLLHA